MNPDLSPLICFDCDSTLTAIEGVDEFARLRGPEILAQSEAMTTAAMEGGTPLQEIFAKRLELIRPTRAETEKVAQLYLEAMEPTALETLRSLRTSGWRTVIISGGFRQAIRPLADHLGVECVEAVNLFFDGEGNYAGFDRDFPTTRSGGKNEIIRRLKTESSSLTVMVGDGASDLETGSDVDLFIGFCGFVERANVKKNASFFVRHLNEIPATLEKAAIG